MAAKNVVLIVEEDDGTREMLQEVLVRLLGVEVVTVANGAEGIQQAHILLPIVVILDVVLPDIDGLDVVKLLKWSKVTRSIPIIGLTANPRLVGGAKEAGCVDCLLKPFIHVQQLTAAVKKYMKFEAIVASN